jgi:hypothetical protein
LFCIQNSQPPFKREKGGLKLKNKSHLGFFQGWSGFKPIKSATIEIKFSIREFCRWGFKPFPTLNKSTLRLGG